MFIMFMHTTFKRIEISGGPKKTKAVEWKFPFNCFCFFGPVGSPGYSGFEDN